MATNSGQEPGGLEGKREAVPDVGGARAPQVPAVSPKPAATRRRRLHSRHLRPNLKALGERP